MNKERIVLPNYNFSESSNRYIQLTLPQSSFGNSVGTRSTQNINTANYASGVYLVKLILETGYEVREFMKE